MLGRLGIAWFCVSLASCTRAPDADAACGTAVIGASGGAVVAPNGATLVVPPGAIPSATEVSICSLTDFTPRRDQQSELVVVRPPSLALARPATFTIRLQTETLSSGRVEIGQSLDDSAPVVITDIRLGVASVSFDHDHFGYMRVLGLATAPVDSGVDPNRDAARPDAGPPRLAPVVVGIDLDPANYACLGTRVISPTGALVPVELRVIDWQDRAPRASYQLRAILAPPNPDLEFDCSTTPDCVMATSDASGAAAVTLPSGPVWFDVVQFDPMGMFIDDRHAPVRQVHFPIDVPVGGGVVELEAVSQRTHTAVGGFTIHFGQLAMGHVRDCDGQAVQRARVRVFDETEGAEITDTGGMLTYGTTSGLPTGGGVRTGADGTFLVDNFVGVQSVRLEAWGQLVLDGPEVMLACELRAVTSSTIVIGDLLPAAMVRSATCSE